MFEKKKLLLIGPPGAGKTTIKQVFFEKVNPLNLIKDTLPPTRGINSKVYILYDFELGVFDLAGQENDNWFSHEHEVFFNTNLIFNVFDANMYFKEIQAFFIKFIDFYLEIKLNRCSLVVFFHKIDLINQILLHRKINAFRKFIEKDLSIQIEIPIYPTSIAPEFFLESFDYIAKLLANKLSINALNENESMYQDFYKTLEIIINYDINKANHFNELFYDLNLQRNNALKHLQRLKKLGLVEVLIDKNQFILTEKADIFKSNITETKKNHNKINQILDAMYLFSNLNEN